MAVRLICYLQLKKMLLVLSKARDVGTKIFFAEFIIMCNQLECCSSIANHLNNLPLLFSEEDHSAFKRLIGNQHMGLPPGSLTVLAFIEQHLLENFQNDRS